MSNEIIHLNRVPAGVCQRKDDGSDVRSVQSGPSTITNLAVADFSGNATCIRCLSYLKASKPARKKMRYAA
jgi:hypothetical protein